MTEEIAKQAAALLARAGVHGHKHAIDAMVAATAHAAKRPVTVLTSDPDDIERLCDNRAKAFKV